LTGEFNGDKTEKVTHLFLGPERSLGPDGCSAWIKMRRRAFHHHRECDGDAARSSGREGVYAQGVQVSAGLVSQPTGVKGGD
jgi:hypothetical protein